MFDVFNVNRIYGVGPAMPKITNADYSNMTALAYWLEVIFASRYIDMIAILDPIQSIIAFNLNTLYFSLQISKMRYNLTGALLGGSMLGLLSSYIEDAIRALQEAARVG